MTLLKLNKKFNSKKEIEQASHDYAQCKKIHFEYLNSNYKKAILPLCNIVLYLVKDSCNDTTEVCEEKNINTFENIINSSSKKSLLSCNDNVECISMIEKVSCSGILCDTQYYNICEEDENDHPEDQAKYCTNPIDKTIICTNENTYQPQCMSICTQQYGDTYDYPMSEHYLYSISEKAVFEWLPIIAEICNLSNEQQDRMLGVLTEDLVDDLYMDCQGN